MSRFSPSGAVVSVPRRGRAAWKRNLSEGRGGKSPPVVPRSCGGGGTEAMDGAGGRTERGRRRTRPAAPRGRGAARAVARSPSQVCSSPGGAATLQAPQRDGAAAQRSRPARPASTVRSLPADPTTNGGRAPPASRGRAPPTRAPAAQRRAALPDGAAAAAVAAPRSLSAAGAPRLRQVLSRLTLDRQDVSEASGLVNRVILKLTEAIRSQGGSFSSIEQLGAGSYYEHVKISEPKKFEVLLEMPVEDLVLSPRDESGVFFDLKFRGVPKEDYLLEFLDEEGKLSARKMLNTLKGIITGKVKTKGFRQQTREKIPGVEVTVKRREPGSPAITLLIRTPGAEISVDIILTLQAEEKVSLPEENWLHSNVKKSIREKPLHLVPMLNTGDHWQLSFSHIEKLMMEKHGKKRSCCGPGVKCCRQECLEHLKYFLEKLKMEFPAELKEFSWLHVQTALFHSCAKFPNDSAWRNHRLGLCYRRVLEGLQQCLRASSLPHFFVPTYNLLSQGQQQSNAFLERKIRAELEKRF